MCLREFSSLLNPFAQKKKSTVDTHSWPLLTYLSQEIGFYLLRVEKEGSRTVAGPQIIQGPTGVQKKLENQCSQKLSKIWYFVNRALELSPTPKWRPMATQKALILICKGNYEF